VLTQDIVGRKSFIFSDSFLWNWKKEVMFCYPSVRPIVFMIKLSLYYMRKG